MCVGGVIFSGKTFVRNFLPQVGKDGASNEAQTTHRPCHALIRRAKGCIDQMTKINESVY